MPSIGQGEAVVATEPYVDGLAKHLATKPTEALFMCNVNGGGMFYFPPQVELPKDVRAWIKRAHHEARGE